MSAPVVGVLGGTFDPVHLGHLQIARRALELLPLECVLLLPTANPPHKPLAALSPVADRLAMLQLAIEKTDRLEICMLELTEDRVCYTVETLRTLAGGPAPSRPVFIVGMDALLQITSWREWRQLLEEFDLAVVDRPELELERVRDRLDAGVVARIRTGETGPPPGEGGAIFHLPGPPIPISSSVIRSRVAAGVDLSDLVPDAVAGYIQRTGLYRREENR